MALPVLFEMSKFLFLNEAHDSIQLQGLPVEVDVQNFEVFEVFEGFCDFDSSEVFDSVSWEPEVQVLEFLEAHDPFEDFLERRVRDEVVSHVEIQGFLDVFDLLELRHQVLHFVFVVSKLLPDFPKKQLIHWDEGNKYTERNSLTRLKEPPGVLSTILVSSAIDQTSQMLASYSFETKWRENYFRTSHF